MSTTAESQPCILDIPINALAPDFFWTRMAAAGVSIEEGEAYRAGLLSRDDEARIEWRVQMSRNRLRDAEVPGVQFWMSHRRMVS